MIGLHVGSESICFIGIYLVEMENTFVGSVSHEIPSEAAWFFSTFGACGWNQFVEFIKSTWSDGELDDACEGVALSC